MRSRPLQKTVALGIALSFIVWGGARFVARRGAVDASGSPLAGIDPIVCATVDGAPAGGSWVEPLSLTTREFLDRARLMLADDRVSASTRAALRGILGSGDGAASAAALDGLIEAPERDQDGFDMALGATAYLGGRAFGRGDLPGARLLAERGRELDPYSPAPWILTSRIEDREGNVEEARRGLAQAFGLSNLDPSLALEVARRAVRDFDLEEAERAMVAYREVYPDDPHGRRLAARVAHRRRIFEGFQHGVDSGLSFHLTPGLYEHRVTHLRGEVVEALEEAARSLGVARRERLHVVVYRSPEEMRSVTCSPSWSGALYDGQLHLHSGIFRMRDGGRATIRHEALHAALADAAPSAPIWLHEGFAQRFAGEPVPGRDASYRLMIENHTWIPFPSLEGTFSVIEERNDARLAYHQSLAIVELLIEREGESVIPRAVRHLAEGGDRRELMLSLSSPEIDGAALLEWIEKRR